MTVLSWYQFRYRGHMAMNLRLPDDLAAALRALAERTGRSQQDLSREAIEILVHDYDLRDFPADLRSTLTPPARPYRRSTPRALRGVSGSEVSDGLLEARSDRLANL